MTSCGLRHNVGCIFSLAKSKAVGIYPTYCEKGGKKYWTKVSSSGDELRKFKFEN